jgi:glycosyltransferase involved in cell wall biosynthesis
MDLTQYSDKLSVVVIAHGELTYLDACLKSLPQCGLEYETILVWNNPVGNFDGDVDVFIETKDMSIAKTLNIGHACARGDYVLQLNDDIEFPEAWEHRLKRGIDYDKFNFVGPMATNCNPEQLEKNVMKPGRHHTTTQVSQLCGFCLYGKRETFKLVGDYDENLPDYAWVDLDFNKRATKLGLKFGVRDDVLVLHKRFNDTSDILAQVPYYKNKYGTEFVNKHFPFVGGVK